MDLPDETIHVNNDEIMGKPQEKPQGNEKIMGKNQRENGGLPSGHDSHSELERSTMFHGKIHYFNGHVQQLCHKLPEGNNGQDGLEWLIVLVDHGLRMAHMG